MVMARQGIRGDHCFAGCMAVVQGEIVGIFIKERSQIGAVSLGDDDVHGTNVFRTLADDLGSSHQCLDHVSMVEALDKIEDLFSADSPLLSDSNAAQLSVENEDVAIVM